MNFFKKLLLAGSVAVGGLLSSVPARAEGMTTDATTAVEALATPIAAVQGSVMTVVIAAVTGWIIIKLVRRGANKV
jgi:hypothetical protein